MRPFAWCLVMAMSVSTAGCGSGPSAEQRAVAEKLGIPVAITNSIGMHLVLIPAGEFMMGPQCRHPVRITRPFYLGIHEVTQEQYERVMGNNPSAFSPGGKLSNRVSGLDTGRLPVESVSWDDAVEFCAKLSALLEEQVAARTYRLPTNAEWEYAVRAGATTAYCFGNDESGLDRYAWYSANSGLRPHPVGKKRPNAWGLHDMHGNVWEWCQCFWGAYSRDPVADPQGPPTGSGRVGRGGSWYDHAVDCRSGYRSRSLPGERYGTLGFRVVAIVSGQAAGQHE